MRRIPPGVSGYDLAEEARRGRNAKPKGSKAGGYAAANGKWSRWTGEKGGKPMETKPRKRSGTRAQEAGIRDLEAEAKDLRKDISEARKKSVDPVPTVQARNKAGEPLDREGRGPWRSE